MAKRFEHDQLEFARAVTDRMASLFPEDPPLFLVRTPHRYHDITRIRADLSAAGFSDIEIQTIACTSTAASASDPAIAYCQGTPLRNEIETRGGWSLGAATAKASDAIREAYGDGPVSAKIAAHVVVARR